MGVGVGGGRGGLWDGSISGSDGEEEGGERERKRQI